MIIITIILAVWACISPFFYFRLFKEEKPVIIPPVKKKKKHNVETPKELQDKIDFLNNVESYYGVGSKQKDIKR